MRAKFRCAALLLTFAIAGGAAAVLLRLSGRQQEQLDPCEPDARGSLALRSLTAMALRLPASIPAMKGARRMARGADSPQSGHAHGSPEADMGFMSLNGPQAAHI